MAQTTPYTPTNGGSAAFEAGLHTGFDHGASAPSSSRPSASNPLQAFGRHLTDLSHETMTLMRQELELAKAEMRDTARELGTGVSELAVGGGIAQAGFLVLLGAAVAGLAQIWPVWLAALVVGGAALLIGLMLASRARSHLDRQNLRPEETIAAARDTRRRVKESLS